MINVWGNHIESWEMKVQAIKSSSGWKEPVPRYFCTVPGYCGWYIEFAGFGSTKLYRCCGTGYTKVPVRWRGVVKYIMVDDRYITMLYSQQARVPAAPGTLCTPGKRAGRARHPCPPGMLASNRTMTFSASSRCGRAWARHAHGRSESVAFECALFAGGWPEPGRRPSAQD